MSQYRSRTILACEYYIYIYIVRSYDLAWADLLRNNNSNNRKKWNYLELCLCIINRTNITRDDTTYVRWNCYILIFFNESLGVKKEVSKSILVFPAIFYKVIGIYELRQFRYSIMRN